MSENSTLEKIFREYHLFSIPSYQRDYAWEIRNFEELWEDLKESIELENTDSDKGHFLGTIVVTPNNQNQNSVDVIDGQQRLTTTFMLLLALWEKLSEEKRDHIGKGFLYEDYKEKTYKLQVSESNREFFRQILESSNQAHLPSKGKLDIKPATQGQNNLYDVFNCILGKIKVFDSKEADSYFTKLINMRLICFKEHNVGAAIRTFQSVNDRGVPLRLLDKLKSLLIYYSNRYCVDDKLDSKINQNFGEIFRFSSQIFAHPYRSTIFATQSN
ncbi:DUF262 domain-containing protein [Helicobacter sp. MIT 05-5293]|uniref:DUF262 domain-containing protein n=1 Tax=Helicobacter sp. MIT 05-5293 TaxID=1548149 RepID=UPI00051D7889|nr:DUF262 domain-containing protein [Helicobacter sp. MIT 05-5293]TLD80831.1 DUF262 domain-containing protein [Helicobacter sp. MIT 05-5293]